MAFPVAGNGFGVIVDPMVGFGEVFVRRESEFSHFMLVRLAGTSSVAENIF